MPPMVHVSVLCFIAELYDRGWRVMRGFQERQQKDVTTEPYSPPDIKNALWTWLRHHLAHLKLRARHYSQHIWTKMELERQSYYFYRQRRCITSECVFCVFIMRSLWAVGMVMSVRQSVSFKSRTRGRILMKRRFVMLLKVVLNS